jgi:hypothetical protein
METNPMLEEGSVQEAPSTLLVFLSISFYSNLDTVGWMGNRLPNRCQRRRKGKVAALKASKRMQTTSDII